MCDHRHRVYLWRLLSAKSKPALAAGMTSSSSCECRCACNECAWEKQIGQVKNTGNTINLQFPSPRVKKQKSLAQSDKAKLCFLLHATREIFSGFAGKCSIKYILFMSSIIPGEYPGIIGKKSPPWPFHLLHVHKPRVIGFMQRAPAQSSSPQECEQDQRHNQRG